MKGRGMGWNERKREMWRKGSLRNEEGSVGKRCGGSKRKTALVKGSARPSAGSGDSVLVGS